jgi:SAM-dependent methyltransferase
MQSAERQRVALFVSFLLIFLVTCLVTLGGLSVYLFRVLVQDQQVAFPRVLSLLIGATILEVAAGIVALYKNLFGIDWGAKENRQSTQAGATPTQESMTAPQRSQDDDRQVVDVTDNTTLEIARDRDDYIRMIEEAILGASSEVLFTTRTMSHPDEEPQQRRIIQASKEFGRKAQVVHRGVICGSPDTIRGAIELKREVSSIELRFNTLRLELRDISYFIVDKSVTILGVGRGSSHTAYLIRSAAFAYLLRSDFEKYWEDSQSMHDYISQTFSDARMEAGEEHALEIIGFNTLREYALWSQQLESTEIVSRPLPADPYSQPEQLSSSGAIGETKRLIHDAVEGRLLTEDKILELRQLIHAQASIDYSMFRYEFLYLYFWANYFKVRLSLLRALADFTHTYPLTVLDLGCGSGASTLAFIDWYSGDRAISTPVSIDAVDNNLLQLELHEQILGASTRDRNQTLERVTRVHMDAGEFLSSTDRYYDIVIDGNFLCELEPNERAKVLRLLSGRLSSNGALLIVEREKSGVYESVEAVENLLLHSKESLGPYNLSDDYRLQHPALRTPSKYTYSAAYSLYVSER